MRHFILARAVLAGPVAARSLRMVDPAATARLVTSPGLAQRPATGMRCTIATVQVTPIAIATDEHRDTAVLDRTQKQPGSRRMAMLATAALVMRQPMAWTPAAVTAMMPPQSCSCTV
jgi:hypothetical protein